MTDLNLSKLFAEANRDLDNKWRMEKTLDKDIKKNLKGLWMLWNTDDVAIAPYYAIRRYDGRISYGSKGYQNEGELTTEEHKKYFALHDKIVKATKSLNRWKKKLPAQRKKLIMGVAQ